MINKNLQQIFYDKFYESESYENSSEKMKEPFINRFLDMVLESEEKDVIEIGCGDGKITRYLLKRNLKVCGVDISPVAIKKMKAQFKDYTKNGQLVVECDDIINYLKKSEKKSDVIIGGGIIHHIKKDEWSSLFTSAFNRLKKGGVFACAPEPNAGGAYFYTWAFLAKFVHKLFKMDYDTEVEKGTLDMKPNFIIKALKSSGFSEVEIKPYQVIPHFNSKFISLIDKRLVNFFKGRLSLYMIIKAKK